MKPTVLMLALSALVLVLDPSVPMPRLGFKSALRESAEHWSAVACYAESFPTALARRLDPERAQGDCFAALNLEEFATCVSDVARAIQRELA